MKTQIKLAAWLLLSTLTLQPSTMFAQGSLTPPGAPAATMKTLDQIYARTDARIPITNSAGTVTIAAPGSYYLTTNLTVSSGDGIVIATNGVTLDLNGYTICSTAASAADVGINLTALAPSDITIGNGHIRSGVTNNGSGVYSGSGFGYGIYYSGSTPANVLVSRVSVAGCGYSGILLTTGNSTVVESCTVQTMGSYGIYASTIKQSTARDCGYTAITGDQVADCRGESTGSGTGLFATAAQNCYGSSSTGIGLYATTAQNCYGSSGSSYGLYATKTATGCYGSSSTGTGLYAHNAAFCTGYRSGGTAIQATIANGCIASSGTNLVTYKYNMP